MTYKSTSKKTLAQAYSVTDKTFANWIKPFEKQIGEYRSRCYTPKQIEIITSLLGMPEHSNLICS
ncbi:DUF4248 domain-containing protein [Aquimarina algiphila]|uniref:DUF4248 domain-containing protein n=1 Tax=Aquimarina algiphila TaxID=2047982 RepID=A0A554VPD3_9FLAO|nr:DUF4248 domain-containing protein [Aquimarina algiphila]TSE10327.1 DUF4248 domain-containing protein [Aquimarina algiphila]